MSLLQSQKEWNTLGENDPLWAILSAPDKIGNKWEIDQFFQTGIDEINNTVKFLSSLKVEISKKQALDFGCGVGRLTQALASFFDQVHGVDIAPSMIEKANNYNKYGKKCTYHVNANDDLKLFPENSFNFIYSHITLQHIEPQYTYNYLKEFMRILAPGGILFFQLPSHRAKKSFYLTKIVQFLLPEKMYIRFRNAYYHWRNNGQAGFPMFGIPKAKVVSIFQQSCGEIVAINENRSAGDQWISFTYCIKKQEN